jgi:class 3 adenylate cyclase/tetratricopeptide (TPR) repeat protein
VAICPNCGEENPERFRLCGFCGTQLKAREVPPQAARKIVSVVFSDLVGSTALGERLDPESLREVLNRYFDEMRRVLERHGGIVEKYIGDAIMAVFGLPHAHEDDALRAMRAAAEMRSVLTALNSDLQRQWGVDLANRIGVNTGEVVVGDAASGQRLVTGDAVNVAARFEQAASSGQVLLGATTHQLVKDAVEIRAVEPLMLKGKSDRLAAFELMDVKRTSDGVARRLDTPLVGRDREVESLVEAFDRAVEQGTCRPVIVLGEAGVGKSRLIVEVTAKLQGSAIVLRGRCLSYGEGITFWPLVEAIKSAAGINEDDSVEAALTKLEAVTPDDDIAARVASVLGLSEESRPIDEIFWAARKLFENIARRKPLVVIFEDLHWAEATFLDFLEHLAELTRDAPVLLLCSARREFFDRRPRWAREVIALDPLSVDESESLVGNILGTSELPASVQTRISEAARGNPLFVEQILAMWIDDGVLRRDNSRWVAGGDLPTVSIPPTISALLTARLDRLAQEERTVLASASVIGQVFYQEAVREISPEALAATVPAALSGLTRSELIRRESSVFAGETFGFRHILIKDAAYAALLKKARAKLHERFATWLIATAGERVTEYEEVVGYHLEQAYQYHESLTVVDEETQSLARKAADWLSSAGRRALARGDVRGAANLLGRAVGLLKNDLPAQAILLPELGEALMDAGELGTARTVLDQAESAAEELDDENLQARTRLGFLMLETFGTVASSAATIEEARATAQIFEQTQHDRGLARAWHVIGSSHILEGRAAQAQEAWHKAIEYAERADDARALSEYQSWLIGAARLGPMPVDEAIRLCKENIDNPQKDRIVESSAYAMLADLLANKGQFTEARNCSARARFICLELGRTVIAAAHAQTDGDIEMLAGDPKAAERELRRGYQSLSEMGEKGFLSTIAGQLADALYQMGHFEAAERFAEIGRDASSPDDLTSQTLWRSVEAKILAVTGEYTDAEKLGREAVDLSEHSDFLVSKGNVRMDLAEVLRMAGQSKGAEQTISEALDLYEQKGATVLAERARGALQLLTR